MGMIPWSERHFSLDFMDLVFESITIDFFKSICFTNRMRERNEEEIRIFQPILVGTYRTNLHGDGNLLRWGSHKKVQRSEGDASRRRNQARAAD
jgi:hypothetical protein